MSSVPLRWAAWAVVAAALTVSAGCGGTSSAPAVANSTPTTPATPVTNSSSSSAAPQSPSSAPPTTPATPAAPAGTTISNIEQMSGWDSCDTCSGGGKIGYSMTQGLDYPEAGTTQFSLAQGAAWAHALWWKRLGNNPTPSHFVLTLDEYMEHPEASFGIEYEANQIVDGEWYDFATQCSFGYGIWQLWDAANQHWTPTSVPCVRPAPSTHVQVRLEFARSNGRAVFVSIGSDGNVVPVNMSFNPQPIDGANGDFGAHIQLNANGNPDPYSVWVHNLSLNYW